MVVHACNPSIQEAEAGRSLILGQLGLHSEFEDSLRYTERPCQKERKKERNSPPEFCTKTCSFWKLADLRHCLIISIYFYFEYILKNN
jgi:hypothetical protein